MYSQMAKYVTFLYYLLLKAAIENFKTLLTEKLTDNKVILSILVATLKTKIILLWNHLFPFLCLLCGVTYNYKVHYFCSNIKFSFMLNTFSLKHFIKICIKNTPMDQFCLFDHFILYRKIQQRIFVQPNNPLDMLLMKINHCMH